MWYRWAVSTQTLCNVCKLQTSSWSPSSLCSPLLSFKQGPDGLPMPGCWQKVRWVSVPGLHREQRITVCSLTKRKSVELFQHRLLLSNTSALFVHEVFYWCLGPLRRPLISRSLRRLIVCMRHNRVKLWNIFMLFSLLCFSCSDHSNLKRMEFVNNASFMVFIVFFNG